MTTNVEAPRPGGAPDRLGAAAKRASSDVLSSRTTNEHVRTSHVVAPDVVRKIVDGRVVLNRSIR